MRPFSQRSGASPIWQGRAVGETHWATGASLAQRCSPHSVRLTPASSPQDSTAFCWQMGVLGQPGSDVSSTGTQPGPNSNVHAPSAATTLRRMRAPSPIIDSHAHLDFDRFDADRDAVVARAADANVDTLITIGTDLPSSRRALALTQSYPNIYCSAGVHPHQVDEFADADWPALVALFDDPKVRAVGETGLDYYYDHGDRARQRSMFARHLELCGEVGRPVVVHIRDAFDDAYRIVEEVGLPAGGVVHCFTGGPEECARAVALGFHISLSGICTFKSAKALRRAVAEVPIERLLIETDSPFLAPTPHRGKRNEPAFVVHTAHEVAKLRGEPIEDICATTRATTIALFGLPLEA